MAMAEGEALFDAGDLAGAKLAFERAVSAEPGNSEGWRRLGQCHADSDDDVKAIMCLRKASLAALLSPAPAPAPAPLQEGPAPLPFAVL